jgi:hypothetical protein
VGDPANHIPLGARIWSDLNDAQVNALHLRPIESVYLKALHHYGAFVMDERGCGGRRCSAEGPLVGMSNLDPPEEAAAYGNVPEGNRYASEHEWSVTPIAGGLTPRYIFAAPWKPPIDFAQHLHVVDPCYAVGSCG